MTAEEELVQLKKELAKDSHNSSKPPSSDGPGRKRANQRKRSEKKTGGQTGHPGHALKAVQRPDEVVKHRPVVCEHCQHSLEKVAGRVKERRQVHDLPEMRCDEGFPCLLDLPLASLRMRITSSKKCSDLGQSCCLPRERRTTTAPLLTWIKRP